jgi:ABC-2 type transport system ATP-binding protein
MTRRFKEILTYRSPSTYLHRIKVPTLIQGGTSDTLFPLENLIDDFTTLKSRGVPVRLVWNCEGHSLCGGNAGPLEEHFNAAVIRWMDHWLKREKSVDTGPQFEWIADNEAAYRSAGVYPPKQRDPLRGTGSGTLPLVAAGPLSSVGFVFIGGQPSNLAVNVPIPAAADDADVVGFPSLTLTYSGLAAPGSTWLYAQIVDDVTGRVVGGQVTPVPVTLDGKKRSVTVELNAIATRATPSSRYRLQVMPGSLIFGLQRSTGTVQLSRIDVSLPVISSPRR